MKHILLFLVPLVFSFSCKKDKSSVQSTFNINGISDVTMETGEIRILDLEIKHVAGEQKSVNLSIKGVPDGVGAKFSTSSGIPDFSTMLTLTTTDATLQGTYPLVITCSDGNFEKNYEFNIHVKDCMKKLTGKKTGIEICGSDQYPYQADVMWVAGLENRIYIVGFAGYEASYIYAEVDCASGRITIPQQKAEGGYYYGSYSISGTGTFLSGRMEFNYTIKFDNEDPQSCTTVLE